jgi:D-sedoheptulose 7-phosphate isomerase
LPRFAASDGKRHAGERRPYKITITFATRRVALYVRTGISYTAKVADACVIVPTVNANNITPHTEAFQAVIWHLWVSHPELKANQTKWESVVARPASN